MNSIDDLKATFAGHAELRDDHLMARSGAVAGRVKAVRRRRTAVGASVAAAVVVGTVGLASVLQQPDRGNERLLVGNAVPATLTSTGYTFEFQHGIEADEGDTTVVADLPKSDVPRLVSWATEGADQDVVVDDGSGRIASSRPDFADFVLVRSGEAAEIEVRGDSRVALAVYDLSDETPAGVSRHGVTYRQQVDGAALLGAVIGEKGEDEVSLVVTVGDGRLEWSDLCELGVDPTPNRVAPLETYYSLSADGRELITTSCANGGLTDPLLDPGTSRHGTIGKLRIGDRTYEPGDQITFTARLTDEDGDPVTDPEAVLGIGIYEEPASARVRVAGTDVGTVVEADGHTWALRSSEATGLPVRDWTVPVPAADERLLLGLAHDFGDANTTVELMMGSQATEGYTGFGAGWSIQRVLAPGVEAVGIRSPYGGSGKVGLLFYELVE